ncbi:MAG TPA: hypothetical protein VLB07_11665, partial [Woeseiaceae bacterium]|nr:hypothetical protein [Woeseiaceae bacterium]
ARLAASATVVLVSSHAFAAGTDAGTTISNQAQVDYAVGGNAQTFILSDPAGNSLPGAGQGSATTFVVDNRVDFSLIESGLAGHTPVTPGQNGEFVQFTLQNTGNSTQDFRLVASNLLAAFGAVNGLTDTEVDMSALTVYVDNDANGLDTGVDQAFVDELAEDGSVDIYVVGNADLTLVNGDIANVNLQAVVADAGAAGLGADTQDDVGNADTAGIDVVFAEGGTLGDGILDAQDGFTVSSAALSITKTATLISDPFNNTTNPKAIPGAVVEYVITVSNATGGSAADNVVITDTLSADITVVDDFFGASGEVQIDNNGAVSTCSQEADVDSCQIVAGALSLGATGAPISVAAAGTLTITFRVTIN